MKSSWLLLAVPVLLGTTALVQGADPVQTYYPPDDAHPIFSLTGTVGGVVMDLPDGGGLFEGEGAVDGNDLLFGGTAGISAVLSTGEVFGGLQGFVGLNLFGTYAYADVNKTSAFTGPGVIVMQGGTGPTSSAITITTSSNGALATSQITSTHENTIGGGADITVNGATNAPGAQDAPYYSAAGTGNSFQWGGAQTRIEGGEGSSTAYAAVADENGAIFIAAGNLDGLNLTQSYRTEAIYLGGDLTFGVSGQHGTTALQGYVGPSYRYLSQRNGTTGTLLVNVPEYNSPIVAEFPMLTMNSTDTFTSHYAGGVAGLMATIPTSATSAFTLGVEGGAYYTMASLTSDGRYTTYGGDLAAGGGVLDPAPAPGEVELHEVEVDGATYDAETIAFAARGTAAYTMAIAPQAQLTFSGSVDYLSAVAKTGVNASIAGYDGTDDGSVTYQSGNGSDRISWGQMVNFSGSVSLTGQF